ncbi:MAG: hypothetical protein GMKNLPBB_01290 [Myxococcota bacterium]|nr:hypothetical protein [Myxococcota bacterium]
MAAFAIAAAASACGSADADPCEELASEVCGCHGEQSRECKDTRGAITALENDNPTGKKAGCSAALDYFKCEKQEPGS